MGHNQVVVYPVRLDTSMYQALGELADSQERTRANMIRVLVRDGLRRAGLLPADTTKTRNTGGAE